MNDTATTEIYTLSLHDALDGRRIIRSEEHTSELQSHSHLVCRLLLAKKITKLELSRDVDREAFLTGLHICHSRFAELELSRDVDREDFVTGLHICQRCVFFFNERATTKTYSLPLPDALRI